VLERQTEFNAQLVRVLNGQLDARGRLDAQLRDLASVLVQFLQTLLPLIDARDRMTSALATTRAELVIESLDRRLESLGRRLEGLAALRDRLEVVSERLRALEAGLAGAEPAPAAGDGVAGLAASRRARGALRAAEDAIYTAFENRFRGDREDVRERLASYVELFTGAAPVIELGCGRGEFLELLRAAGLEARGVDANAAAVAACRERGLAVEPGDLVGFLAAQPDASVGGVFAAQVAEHLPPAVLQRMLAECHRVLRPGGRLVLETVNVTSLLGLLEGFQRDLTHEKPLHPETLRFLVAAAGFAEARVEYRSPVEPSSRLQPIPPEGLPEAAAGMINENVRRLNDLLYGPLDYALIARRH
jgi:SAM-dependent methyltransferase